LFTDESLRSGIAQVTTQSLTFGCFFMDYDLDGLLDIVAANGHVSDDIAVVQPALRYAQSAGIYRNVGNRKFENVSDKLGRSLQKPVVARGIAYADFDNDGDLDLVITANNGPARLLRNDNANQNDVLRLKLIGTRSNRDAIGAKVTVTTNSGAVLSRMVKGGSSYLSQSELPLTFGLGKPGSVKSVRVQIVWPRGRKDSLADVQPNQSLTIQEGKGIVAATPIQFVPTPIGSVPPPQR
jgi:hypothetical protein